MGKCKFKDSWLDQECLGQKISIWRMKFDNENLYCIACDKKVLVARGYQAVEQHAHGDKHKKCLTSNLHRISYTFVQQLQRRI